MKHKYKIGQDVTVRRSDRLYKTQIIGVGEEAGFPVYDTADKHWCYETQIAEASDPVTVSLSKQDAEKIAELLRGDHDDRAYATSLLTAANPGIAAYVVLARPCRRDWFWSLRAAVSAELVEECRRRISAGGGDGAAARRWASG